MGSTVHIGLGSNLGDRERHLLDAVEALSRTDVVSVNALSSLYDTAPVGPPQPRYLNAVVEVDCELPPGRLLSLLQRIELDLGRKRDGRWGPRSIDLDLLLWGTEIVAEPNLQIPHLFLHRRRFALEPLVELAPDSFHPVLGAPMRDLLASIEPQDVVRQAGGGWHRLSQEPRP